ncbi:MAG TPA: hypothetical protein VIG24_16370 [Acidimicrobiia bacterium]
MSKTQRDYYINMVTDAAEMMARARLVNPDGVHADRMNPTREFHRFASAFREAHEAGLPLHVIRRARTEGERQVIA